MIDLASLPLVSQARGQSSHQSIMSIGGLQQQSSTIGTPLSLIELGHYRLAKNSWEQQTLCCAIFRHSEASFVAANRSSQHVCNRGGFCCLSNSRIIRASDTDHNLAIREIRKRYLHDHFGSRFHLRLRSGDRK